LHDCGWLLAQARAGRTITEIADALGCARGTVGTALRRKGAKQKDRQ